MALFTSQGGSFEISALQFSPKYPTWGESVSCTVKVKNVSGADIANPWVTLTLEQKNTSGGVYGTMIGSGIRRQGTWKKNGSITLTFSGTVTRLKDAAAYSERLMPSYNSSGVVLDIFDSSEVWIDGFNDIYGTDHEYFGVLDCKYSPSIPSFEVSRTSDESTSVWTTLKLGCASGLDTTQKARMAYKAYVDGKEVTIPSTITQAMLFTGITENTTFLSGTEVGVDSDHVVTVTWGDSYESASASYTVLRSFANLHLSGYSTGGACFGGFCSNETDATGAHVAKLESYYPIYARKGIQNIQAGVSDSITVASGAIQPYTVTYSFSAAPVVVATAYSNSTAAAMGSLLVAVKQSTVTATGCTINIYNNTGASRTLYVSWLAYGLPTT